ncbi:hypothetical protein QWZ08_25465 [Ferruginibacter paludis]|uniref:hypothetical protein n=1 Tax=Ferruginibacter paludis TaxID=1310417 RepID=UPI0025B40D12|nr:hypothetical protein [Ferruginibacter paludis]MDN3659018.1 hypothetical protein [Ferruginibacter paludis]
MKKNKDTTPEPIAPELKHDTMEFAASTDGDDQLDMVNEEEEITADELDALEEKDIDGEAYALIAAETDSESDEDNFLTSPDDFDELAEEDEDEEDEEKEFRR